MRLFFYNQLDEALAYSLSGETAVHLHRIVFANSPYCFRRCVQQGYPIAHIFSQDAELLRELAVRSGIRVVYIDKEGTARQHLDMCGQPLRHLLDELGYDLDEFRS
jgi:hypothetical protein